MQISFKGRIDLNQCVEANALKSYLTAWLAMAEVEQKTRLSSLSTLLLTDDPLSANLTRKPAVAMTTIIFYAKTA